MYNILIIADSFPQPDKASGDLRLFTLLLLLAKKHQIIFFLSNRTGSGYNVTGKKLAEAGIILISNSDLLHVLKNFIPNIVWFEFFYQVRQDYLRLLQRYCPKAWLVVDSVDVHFNRFDARAKLTGRIEDRIKAKEVKVRELTAYVSTDMVITVSEDDKRLLQRELPDIPIEVIPNIHAMPAFPNPDKRRHGELIFVGGFRHDPNLDAMQYFCQDVMPLIISSCPKTRLKIIGSNPPRTIHALESKYVEVLGYVPETAPYLEEAYISVAPLRYGGGMKGKVGEAMSYGLPVVTTSIGAEGFGITPDRDLLIGDTPESFAAQVIALMNDPALYKYIAKNGYDFLNKHYSIPAVEKMLDSSMQRLVDLPSRKIRLAQRLISSVNKLYIQHIAWRIHK